MCGVSSVDDIDSCYQGYRPLGSCRSRSRLRALRAPRDACGHRSPCRLHALRRHGFLVIHVIPLFRLIFLGI